MSDITNKNFLSPLNFKFIMKRAPHVNFFIQKITIPGIVLSTVFVPSPIVRVPEPGDHLEFEDLTISFIVDENLQNYLEIQNWLRAVGKLTFDSHRTLASSPVYLGESLKSEISVTVLTSNKNPNYEIVFEDAFPTRISGISFDSSMEDVNYLEAEASFIYTKYEIKKISA